MKKSYWLPHPTGREVMIGGGKEGIGSDWSVSNFYELKKTSRLHSIIINAIPTVMNTGMNHIW